MKCLVTAGNTRAMIDQVRCVTNIFSGRTGASIAQELHQRGHDVTVLTSHPETLSPGAAAQSDKGSLTIKSYSTFENLFSMMQEEIKQIHYDAVVHSAAVSDYLSAGVYGLATSTHFDTQLLQWKSDSAATSMIDASAGKVKSNHNELWLKFVKAPKIIDQLRSPWGFQGKLVKFKLEVDIQQTDLQAIAEASRLQSKADYMVANTLAYMHQWALVGPIDGRYDQVPRAQLATRLVHLLETN